MIQTLVPNKPCSRCLDRREQHGNMTPPEYKGCSQRSRSSRLILTMTSQLCIFPDKCRERGENL